MFFCCDLGHELGLGSPDVCGGTKEAEPPYPRPFLVTYSKYFDFGNILIFVIPGVNASLRVGSVDLCDCWHQGVIQAGQPGLMQGADEVNVGLGVHLSLCLWGSMRH